MLLGKMFGYIVLIISEKNIHVVCSIILGPWSAFQLIFKDFGVEMICFYLKCACLIDCFVKFVHRCVNVVDFSFGPPCKFLLFLILNPILYYPDVLHLVLLCPNFLNDFQLPSFFTKRFICCVRGHNWNCKMCIPFFCVYLFMRGTSAFCSLSSSCADVNSPVLTPFPNRE